jgi:hypothetical protein
MLLFIFQHSNAQGLSDSLTRSDNIKLYKSISKAYKKAQGFNLFAEGYLVLKFKKPFDTANLTLIGSSNDNMKDFGIRLLRSLDIKALSQIHPKATELIIPIINVCECKYHHHYDLAYHKMTTQTFLHKERISSSDSLYITREYVTGTKSNRHY